MGFINTVYSVMCTVIVFALLGNQKYPAYKEGDPLNLGLAYELLPHLFSVGDDAYVVKRYAYRLLSFFTYLAVYLMGVCTSWGYIVSTVQTIADGFPNLPRPLVCLAACSVATVDASSPGSDRNGLVHSPDSELAPPFYCIHSSNMCSINSSHCIRGTKPAVTACTVACHVHGVVR